MDLVKAGGEPDESEYKEDDEGTMAKTMQKRTTEMMKERTGMERKTWIVKMMRTTTLMMDNLEPDA